MRRLSRLPHKEHGAIRADSRFQQLMVLTEAQLGGIAQGRNRQVDPRDMTGILNGAWPCH